MSTPNLDAQAAEDLLQSLPDGVITMRESGEIEFLNRAAERITGWTSEEAAGKSLNALIPLAGAADQLIDVLARTAAPPVCNSVTRQGRELTVAVKAAPVKGHDGASARSLILIRDVTAEDAAQRLRSYFLANISHEFRTPLSALKASVELLLEGVDTFTRDETSELARSIHFSVTALQTLVDNLLESVSIDAGRFRIRQRSTHIAPLVADAQALMKPLLERRHQALITCLPRSLPSISADPMRITQVLVNLLSNASKYGPVDEPIELTVELCAGHSMRLSVADRGSGIPAEERQNIFRRFVRVNDKDKDNTQYGVGLGLWVVKTIIESHGGAVGLDERPGGGTVFWCTLPLKED